MTHSARTCTSGRGARVSASIIVTENGKPSYMHGTGSGPHGVACAEDAITVAAISTEILPPQRITTASPSSAVVGSETGRLFETGIGRPQVHPHESGRRAYCLGGVRPKHEVADSKKILVSETRRMRTPWLQPRPIIRLDRELQRDPGVVVASRVVLHIHSGC